MLALLPQHIAVEVISLVTHLKASIEETLVEKFAWTKTVPYRAVAVWLCTIGKITLDTAKRIYR